MSSLSAVEYEEISSQDVARAHVRDLLTGVAEHLAMRLPELDGLYEHRPSRDRSSGTSWRGIETICHVSALLASARVAPAGIVGQRRVFDALEGWAAGRHLRRGADLLQAPLPRRVWTTEQGDRLEIACGVRVTVRVISAPYLPGSLTTAASTSPVTPPPRPIR